MHAKVHKNLDSMAVLNKETRTAEVCDVNCIGIDEIHILYRRKVAQISFKLGCCDSKGKFNVAPEYDKVPARMNVESPEFDQIFLDLNGNPKPLAEDEFERLFEYGIPKANKEIFGIQDLEASVKLPGRPEKIVARKAK